MANIRIKRKENGGNQGMVYWIIGFILVAVIIIWAVAEFTGRVERETASTGVYDQEIKVREREDATSEYIDFVDEIDSRIQIDYSVTSKGLVKLSDALQELGGNQVEDEARLIKSHARAILKTDNYMLHSRLVGEAFQSASNALETIQKNKLPDAGQDVRQVKDVAQSFDEDRILMEQKETIKRFFDETAQVVEEAGTPIVSPS